MRAWHRLTFGVLLLAYPATAAAAQAPASADPPLVLLLNERVQDELHLDAAQRDRLRKLPDAVRARHQKLFDELKQQLKDLRDKTAKAQEEYLKGLDAAAARILTREQADRLRQIERQSLGLALFADPEAAAALRLNDKQKQALAAAVGDIEKAQAAVLAKELRLTPPEAVKLRQKAFAALAATLTDEQKAALKGLLGEPSRAAAERFPLGMVGQVPESLRRSVRINLLDLPELADELKLSEAQRDDLRSANKELQARVRKLLPPDGGAGPLVKLAQLERQAADETRTEAEELLNPEQKARLAQLAVQARGLGAFEDIAVLRALKLTPEQARAVEDASKAVAKKRQEFVAEVGKSKTPVKEALANWAKREAQLHRDAVAGLVAGFGDSQKEAWAKQTGKAFDVGKAGIPPSAVRLRGEYFNPTAADAEVSPGRAYLNAGTVAYYQQEYDRALADYDACLNLDPDNAYACNSKAWLLATCPEAKVRDGLEAIRLAKKACELTKDRTASFLDTLGAAYAEAGEFEAAVAAQTRALELATPPERAEFALRLKLFREKKKYREAPGKGGAGT